MPLQNGRPIVLCGAKQRGREQPPVNASASGQMDATEIWLQRWKQRPRLLGRHAGDIPHRGSARSASNHKALDPVELFGVAGDQHGPGAPVAKLGFPDGRQLRDQVGVVFTARGIQPVEVLVLRTGNPRADDAGTGSGRAPFEACIHHHDPRACTGQMVGGTGPKDAATNDDYLHTISLRWHDPEQVHGCDLSPRRKGTPVCPPEFDAAVRMSRLGALMVSARPRSERHGEAARGNLRSTVSCASPTTAAPSVPVVESRSCPALPDHATV